MNTVAFISGGEAGAGATQEFWWKDLSSMKFLMLFKKAGQPGVGKRSMIRRPITRHGKKSRRTPFLRSPFSFIQERAERGCEPFSATASIKPKPVPC